MMMNEREDLERGGLLRKGVGCRGQQRIDQDDLGGHGTHEHLRRPKSKNGNLSGGWWG